MCSYQSSNTFWVCCHGSIEIVCFLTLFIVLFVTFILAGFMIIDDICPFNATVTIGLFLEHFDVEEDFSCTTVLCILIAVQHVVIAAHIFWSRQRRKMLEKEVSDGFWITLKKTNNNNSLLFWWQKKNTGFFELVELSKAFK